jgi:hypothetical protein
VTLFVVGLSPIVFLLGLLDARLARSSIGDLVLELRKEPAPSDLRDALANALRDPTLDLAYWLPDFRIRRPAGPAGEAARRSGPHRDLDRARRPARRRAAPRPGAR